MVKKCIKCGEAIENDEPAMHIAGSIANYAHIGCGIEEKIEEVEPQ